MHAIEMSRRNALMRTGLLISGAAAAGALGQSTSPAQPESAPHARPFRFCLNMATIRGQKLGLLREIQIAAQAGYDAIEPWVDSIQDFVKSGGSLKEASQRIRDSGLTVESAIGFPEWVVDDDTRRAAGLERAKREMELVAQLGGKRFACPPAGATNLPKLDVLKAAERYRALLEAGDQIGLVPQLELWGFSQNLSRLGGCVSVAMETGHSKACVLADVFHLYKGGSDYHGLRLLGPDAVQVLHMNDYPADPPREKINDSYRVYPGDGTAPLGDLLRVLRQTGGQKVLSLELFSETYWKQDASLVASAGLAKMKAVAEKAMG